MIWLYYLVMVTGRFYFGLRAKRAAYLAIFGFACVALSFIGLDNILGESRHF